MCPACRKAYPEDPAGFKPLSQEEVARLKAEKRLKDQQRKQKITENRKHLANVRVVQRNLVFVVGLPVRLADAEVKNWFFLFLLCLFLSIGFIYIMQSCFEVMKFPELFLNLLNILFNNIFLE